MTNYQRNLLLRGQGGDSSDAGYTSADGASLKIQDSHEQMEDAIKEYLNDCIAESNSHDYVHFDSRDLNYYSVQNPETIREWSYIYQQLSEAAVESEFAWERFTSNENTENLKNAGIELDYQKLYYACLSNANLVGDDIFDRIADSEYLQSKGFTVEVFDSAAEAFGSTATVSIYPFVGTISNGELIYTDSDKATNKANALRGLFDKSNAAKFIPYYSLLKLAEEGTITYKELAVLEFCGDFSDRFNNPAAVQDVEETKKALGINTYAYYAAYDLAANAIYDEMLSVPNVQSEYDLTQDQINMANSRDGNHNFWVTQYGDNGEVSYHHYSLNESYSAYIDALALEERARKLRETDPAAAAGLYTQAAELLTKAFDCFNDERSVEILREAYANGQVDAETLARYESSHCAYWTDEFETEYLQSLSEDGRELTMGVFCKTNFTYLMNMCSAKASCITTDLNAGGDGKDKSEIPVLAVKCFDENGNVFWKVTNGSITVHNATVTWNEELTRITVRSDNGLVWFTVDDPVFTYDENSRTIVITGGIVTPLNTNSLDGVLTPGNVCIEVTDESQIPNAMNQVRGYKGGAGGADSTYDDSKMENDSTTEGTGGSGGGGGGGDGGGGGGDDDDGEWAYYDYYHDAIGSSDSWVLVQVYFGYHVEGFTGGATNGHDCKHSYDPRGCAKSQKTYYKNFAMRSDSKMVNGSFDLDAWIWGDRVTGRCIFHHLKIIATQLAGPFRSEDAVYAYARRNNLSFTRTREYATAYARGMEDNARTEKKLQRLEGNH